MNTTRALHDLGQSLWLDNITREMLNQGTLRDYINEFSITGLTSNPTIFDQAIGASAAYDAGIRDKWHRGKSAEQVFIELALEDLGRAADLLRPVFEASKQLDGWVSMEISPLLSADVEGSVDAAKRIHEQAGRPNLFVKIPGTAAGLKAMEACIFEGIPINVTLLFSREHYLAAAEAYMRGIERRLEIGLHPGVVSVASLFVSRWDTAVHDIIPESLRNHLGITIAQRSYHAYRQLLASTRWQHLAKAGARPQRLLWASTGSKDPQSSDTLYVEALAA
ncbi:MAG: transaldolase, partial [Pseudomonadales bacterium]|nr:transaldolase [Pseudomonadales bacterium]